MGRRGNWSRPYIPKTPQGQAAQRTLRQWEWQQRWAKHTDRLGPIPAKWMDVGPRPSPAAVMQMMLVASEYRERIQEQLEKPSILRQYFKE